MLSGCCFILRGLAHPFPHVWSTRSGDRGLASRQGLLPLSDLAECPGSLLEPCRDPGLTIALGLDRVVSREWPL